jgi:hypothetical protein
MSGKRTLLYWDTCVFLAWIKQETVWPKDVTDGIQIEEWRAGRVIIVTSSITMLEILSTYLTVGQKDAFAKAFSSPQLQMVDVDRRVSGKAAVIREYYDDRVFNPDGSKKSGHIIGMGDAIHLATALNFDVSEFQTLDGSGRRKRKFDLLALDGNVAGARLNIRLPKYIPPPKFSEGPIPPTAGQQQRLFDEDAAEDNPSLLNIASVITVIKAAITQGYFKKDDNGVATKADPDPA